MNIARRRGHGFEGRFLSRRTIASPRLPPPRKRIRSKGSSSSERRVGAPDSLSPSPQAPRTSSYRQTNSSIENSIEACKFLLCPRTRCRAPPPSELRLRPHAALRRSPGPDAHPPRALICQWSRAVLRRAQAARCRGLVPCVRLGADWPRPQARRGDFPWRRVTRTTSQEPPDRAVGSLEAAAPGRASSAAPSQPTVPSGRPGPDPVGPAVPPSALAPYAMASRCGWMTSTAGPEVTRKSRSSRAAVAQQQSAGSSGQTGLRPPHPGCAATMLCWPARVDLEGPGEPTAHAHALQVPTQRSPSQSFAAAGSCLPSGHRDPSHASHLSHASPGPRGSCPTCQCARDTVTRGVFVRACSESLCPRKPGPGYHA